jgi:hypothetical protein
VLGTRGKKKKVKKVALVLRKAEIWREWYLTIFPKKNHYHWRMSGLTEKLEATLKQTGGMRRSL